MSEHNKFWVETNLPTPISQIYVNLLEGICIYVVSLVIDGLSRENRWNMRHETYLKKTTKQASL
jgi:hypothetical protein